MAPTKPGCYNSDSLWLPFDPVWAGELALEKHCGTGPAVDAQVPAAGLVPGLQPHPAGAGRMEEALHPDCAGAAAQICAGAQPLQRNRFVQRKNGKKKIGSHFFLAVVGL